jgi:hypothetical protein
MVCSTPPLDIFRANGVKRRNQTQCDDKLHCGNVNQFFIKLLGKKIRQQLMLSQVEIEECLNRSSRSKSVIRSTEEVCEPQPPVLNYISNWINVNKAVWSNQIASHTGFWLNHAASSSLISGLKKFNTGNDTIQSRYQRGGWCNETIKRLVF